MPEDHFPEKDRRLLLVAAAATAAVSLAVASGLVPAGVPGQWVIEHIRGAWFFPWQALAVLGLLLLLVGTAFRRIDTARWYEEGLAVAMLAALLLAMQFAVGSLGRYGSQESLIALTTATTNMYFDEAGTIDSLPEYLATYPKRAEESKNWQLKTHPPGPVVFFHAIRSAVRQCPRLKDATLALADRLIPEPQRWRNIESFAFLRSRIDSDAEAAGWLGVASLRLAAALSVVPLYVLARAVAGRKAALASAALGGVVPSLLLFNATIDQLYPLLGLTALLAGWHAAKHRSMALNVVTGLALFAGMFFSLSFLMFIALILGLQAWKLMSTPGQKVPAEAIKTLVRMTESLLIGVMLGMVAVYLASGLKVWGVWARCYAANADYNASHTYVAWLLANPLVFAVFLGVPSALLFGRRLHAEAAAALRTRNPFGIDVLVAATACVLLLLWLWGANLGEVERLWMPLMPLCVMAGVRRAEFSRNLLLGLVGLQGLQAIVFRMSLDVLLKLGPPGPGGPPA